MKYGVLWNELLWDAATFHSDWYILIMIRFAVDDAINSPVVRNYFKYNNEQG